MSFPRNICLALLTSVIVTGCGKSDVDSTTIQPAEDKSVSTPAQVSDSKQQNNGKTVTKDNYAFAMVNMAMQKEFAQGANNTSWNHHRTLIPLDKQPAPMMNRDTLYSFSVIDGGGDVAITLPETDGRYQSLHIFNSDHVTYKVFTGAGRHIIPADKSTEYFVANVRTQIDPSSVEDVQKANAYQDQLQIEFLNDYEPTPFQVTNWNMEEFKSLHEHYVGIAQSEGVTGTMGTIDNPVATEDINRGVATATGLLPDNEAVYLTGQYQKKKGEILKASYNIPEQTNPELGFYSITMYGDDQYLHTDQGSSISNSEIELNPDGKSFDIYYVDEEAFGTHTNELIVPTETFNITMRIYLPGQSVQDGEYSLPEPVLAEEIDTGVGENGMALESSPSFQKDGVPVDMFNIVRAETAKYFAEETILSGGNTMRHERTGIDLSNQTVIRSNFDLIYSYGVYDASGGIEVEVPEYDLYQIVQIFDENHVTLAVVYPGQKVQLGPDDLTYGDHVYLFMRTQQRTPDEKGLEELNARQDAVVISASSSAPYVSEVKYDPESFNDLRIHLLTTGIQKAVIHEGFIEDIEDIVFPHYQMVNLGGWAGLPAKQAFYFVVVPGDEGSKQGKPSSMTFRPPPVQYENNGYWSLTIYDEQGWVVTEKYNMNSLKAKPNEDGSYTLHFNTPGAINNIEVPKNWNGLMRCYLPDSLDKILEFQKEAMQALPTRI